MARAVAAPVTQPPADLIRPEQYPQHRPEQYPQ